MGNHKIAVGASAMACLMGAGSAAFAASAPTAGSVRVFVSDQTATKGNVLFTGAIADYGKEIAEDSDGKVDPNGNFLKVTLRQGGFTIDTTALNRSIQRQFGQEPINRTNCSLALSGTGPASIEDGTGAYAGISGRLKVTLIVAGITAKTKNGKCNPGGTAEFYGQYTSVTATGTVAFK